MTEEAYSKREQDHFFGELFKRMDKQDASLNRIETQTMKTNGRVSKLEWWKTSFVWALGALWALLIVAFPLLRQLVRQEIRQTVDISINNALRNYGTEANH